MYTVVFCMQAPDVKQEAASQLATELYTAYSTAYNAANPHTTFQRSIQHSPTQVKTILAIS